MLYFFGWLKNILIFCLLIKMGNVFMVFGRLWIFLIWFFGFMLSVLFVGRWKLWLVIWW